MSNETNTAADAKPLVTDAGSLKRATATKLDEAYAALQAAQEYICNVEGDGSSDIYDDIADAYIIVSKLRDRVRKLKPTGVFKI